MIGGQDPYEMPKESWVDHGWYWQMAKYNLHLLSFQSHWFQLYHHFYWSCITVDLCQPVTLNCKLLSTYLLLLLSILLWKRDQLKSHLCFNMRTRRVTVSKLRAVCVTDETMPSLSLTMSCCYPEVKTSATVWA